MGVYIKGATQNEVMKVLMHSTYWLSDDVEIMEIETPHGRLIDADVCKQRVYDGSRTPYKGCPTVIEAEGE